MLILLCLKRYILDVETECLVSKLRGMNQEKVMAAVVAHFGEWYLACDTRGLTFESSHKITKKMPGMAE